MGSRSLFGDKKAGRIPSLPGRSQQVRAARSEYAATHWPTRSAFYQAFRRRLSRARKADSGVPHFKVDASGIRRSNRESNALRREEHREERTCIRNSIGDHDITGRGEEVERNGRGREQES